MDMLVSNFFAILSPQSIFHASASAKMSNTSAVTPFPGIFNSSLTPAGLPWDTYSKPLSSTTTFSVSVLVLT